MLHVRNSSFNRDIRRLNHNALPAFGNRSAARRAADFDRASTHRLLVLGVSTVLRNRFDGEAGANAETGFDEVQTREALAICRTDPERKCRGSNRPAEVAGKQITRMENTMSTMRLRTVRKFTSRIGGRPDRDLFSRLAT